MSYPQTPEIVKLTVIVESAERRETIVVEQAVQLSWETIYERRARTFNPLSRFEVGDVIDHVEMTFKPLPNEKGEVVVITTEDLTVHPFVAEEVV